MKYPAILRLANGSIVLAVKDGCGVALSNYEDDYERTIANCYYTDFNGFCRAKNITREYLDDTYGEVGSQEHAEFIVKLARVNGFNCDIIISTEKARSFAFYDSGNFYLDERRCYRLSQGKSKKHRKITLPLPPKDENMKSEDVKSEDWPKVGDEVLISGLEEDSRYYAFEGLKVEVVGVANYEGLEIITFWQPLRGLGAMVSGGWFKKPQTQVEVLAELIDESLCATVDMDEILKIAKVIIEGGVKGVTYKPKQGD